MRSLELEEQPRKPRTKKWVPFRRDPEILARLASISKMMLRGAETWQIAQTFDISLRTAQRDVRRVNLLWAEESLKEIEKNRAKSLAGWDEVQEQGWTIHDQRGKKAEERNVTTSVAGLKVVIDAKREIDKITGVVAPVKVARTNKEGTESYGGIDGFSEDQWVDRLLAIAAVLSETEGVEEHGETVSEEEHDVSPVDDDQSADSGQGQEDDKPGPVLAEGLPLVGEAV